MIARDAVGRQRQSCPAEGCGFTYYGDHSIGTGAIVQRGERVLLIERRRGERRWWQIPGGYVEVDEPIDEAVVREVMEETGVTARVTEVLGFRHSAGVQPDRPVSNIYVVFRLEAVSGEPRADGLESFDAGFFAPGEIEQLPEVSAMSRWAIEKALRGGGFLREAEREGLHRPGFTLFGLP
jgi:ADP-ribose pyrophosphatase YjhB (NUDIX family)